MTRSIFLAKVHNKSKNNNHFNQNDPPQQQQPTHPTTADTNPYKAANKSKKKTDKNKRIDAKRSITKFFKTTPKDSIREQQPTTSKGVNSSLNEGNTKPLLPTKVKSGSWKRSEKANVITFSALTNRKNKSLRKKSPNLLKLSNVQFKVNDKSLVHPLESNSACRPGTLYSDVVFGAAAVTPTGLVKVKTMTPRRNGSETAQKKLTKALCKYSTETQEREKEPDHNVFPLLQEMSHSRVGAVSNSLRSLSPMPCTLINSESLTTSASSPSRCHSDEEADVVILSEHNEQPEAAAISYGSYLEQQFQELSVNSTTSQEPNLNALNYGSFFEHLRQHTRISLDIAPWNFTECDVTPEGYPKFLRQFDDDNYLRAEKLAMLALNLALGDSPERQKFKL